MLNLSRNTESNKTESAPKRVLRWRLVLAVLTLATAILGTILVLGGINARARGPAVAPTATPSPTPSLQLAPVAALPGTLVTANGTGWREGDTIIVALVTSASSDNQDAQLTLASATASAGGGFSVTFPVASDGRWAGLSAALIRAWSPSSGAEAFAVLRLAPPTEASEPTPESEPGPSDTPTPVPPTPAPTDPVLSPTPEPGQSGGPAPTPVTPCTDKSAFVRDVTIPDNSYLTPGQSFVKTWRLRNAGTCTWTTDYALVFSKGHSMGAPLVVPLREAVAAGDTVDLSVSMTAPSGNGTYEGQWQLRNASGVPFGTGGRSQGTIWVRIIIGPTPTPVVPISGWRGEYYANRDLSGTPAVVRDDATIGFGWGASAPAAGIAADGFSARWTRILSFSGGSYRFYARSDDGVRVWLDGVLIIDRWRDAAGTTYSVDRTLTAGGHTIRVEYYENLGVAEMRFWWEHMGDFPQWRGEYFSNVTMTANPALVRNETEIDFDWRRGAPAGGLPVDLFSARWTRTLWFEEGLYRFHALVDDGVRLYVDGALVIDGWQDGARRELTADRLLASDNHALRVEYYERAGDALIRIWWERVARYPDWKGEYWSNRDLRGNPAIVRNDAALDFQWSRGAPGHGLPSDDFSARWTRRVRFDAGTYRFHVLVDDGVRLWVDDQKVIDAWREGALREFTGDLVLTGGEHGLRVEYYEHTGEARIRVWWEKLGAASYADWKGEYWSNRKLSGSPTLVRNDTRIDFQWGRGAPAAGLPADDFSTRWTRQMSFQAGIYRFHARADDGIRLYVDGKLMLDEWHESDGADVYVVDVPLVTGQHKLRVEYYERSGNALAELWWKRVGDLPQANKPPEAADDAAITDEDTRVYINVLANDSDADGDKLTVSAYDARSARGGRVECTTAGVCAYNPPADFNGTDTFKYTASDGKGGTDQATVTVTVNPVNDPPVAVDDSASTESGTAVQINVLGNDSDPDGDSLTVSAYDVGSAQGGTVGCTPAGACTYSPRSGFSGTDTFGYTASDGKGGTDSAKVTVLVQQPIPANRTPVAVDDDVDTDQGLPVLIYVLANDSDADGDTLSVSAYDLASAQGGVVACTPSGVCTYTPALGFIGTDTFTYVANDGKGGTGVGTVNVTVGPSQPPVPAVRINEILPVPAPAGADGAAAPGQPDEWVELYNASPTAVDLGGWYLDDDEGGSAAYRIPTGTLISAGGFIVFPGRATGVALDDGGDQVRLLTPDGTLVDAVTFGPLAANASYSRSADGTWHSDWPPSPGGPNLSPTSPSLTTNWRSTRGWDR